MKYSTGERQYLVLSILILIFLFWLLYLDYQRSLASGERRVVGTITFKNRVAQRKYEGQVVWENIPEQKVPVYNRDSIRTADLSTAMIELKNGVKIDLEPNTMIILNISEAEANINFEYGSISTKGSTDGAGKEASESFINIVSGDKKVALKEGSDVHLAQNKENDFTLFVKKGVASLLTDEGKEKTIEENQKADFTKETTAEALKVEEVPVTLTTPPSEARIFSDTRLTPVQFEWKNDQKFVDYTFEINTHRDFTKNRIARNLTGAKTEAPLEEGDYYWRVVAKEKNGNVVSSEVRHLSIVQKVPLQLISPGNNTTFPYVEQSPYINFLWTKDSLADGYKIEIATDPEFSTIVRSADTMINNVSLKVDEGNYYVRIKTKSLFEQAVQTTAAKQFKVTRQTELPAPIPIRPAPAERIKTAFIEKNGYIFSWNKSPEITNTIVEIAKDQEFTQNVASWKGTANFHLLKETLPAGVYYWRLKGVGAGGNQTRYSASRQFSVSDIDTIVLLKPNSAATLDMSETHDGIEFIWSDTTDAPFTFVLATDPELKNTVKSLSSAAATLNLGDLRPNKYYWKVFKKNEGGKLVADSKMQSFTLENKMEYPEPIFPIKNKKVDMSGSDELLLKWEGVEGAASYRLKLYQIVNGTRKEIFETRTGNTQYIFNDISKLDTGSFVWSVTAEGGKEANYAKSEEIKSGFSITLPDLPPPKIISPTTQSIE